jgi:ATP-dependent exoDNAse (exonuclease V) beta subunit
MPQQKALKLVRASAGSGKTFALTAHYLVLLFSGKGKYREILAVTFTNKATAEMKERILGALEELARSGFEKSKFGDNSERKLSAFELNKRSKPGLQKYMQASCMITVAFRLVPSMVLYSS